jgi:hypothetical protein
VVACSVEKYLNRENDGYQFRLDISAKKDEDI